jgi:hypothetical protein
MTFKRITTAAVLVAAAACVSFAAAQSLFKTRLSTVPIDPSTRSVTTGIGNATASLDGRRLVVTGSFEGLQGPASAARLYQGAGTGIRGSAIHDLEVTRAVSGALGGAVELSSRQANALRAGQLYIQIDSESAPEGNLWGWLLP